MLMLPKNICHLFSRDLFLFMKQFYIKQFEKSSLSIMQFIACWEKTHIYANTRSGHNLW